jgi:hypothetical protein
MTSIRRKKMTNPEKGGRASLSRSPFVNTNPIPPLMASVTSTHIFRYVANNGATGQSISRAQLLNSSIMNVSGSTTNYRIINAIRVNRVDMYVAGPAPPGSNTVQLEWVSTYGPSKLISDTSVSSAQVAMIRSKPPPQSLASFWSLRQANESDTLMFLTCPASTIVDVSVNIVLADDSVAVSVSTSSTGTIGVLYATYLDGPRGSAIFTPISLPSLN